ncbi:alpha-galactosidase [Bacteroidia bacterium]|nr:alpha-galactosidase [Bacteroidia bacterium]
MKKTLILFAGLLLLGSVFAENVPIIIRTKNTCLVYKTNDKQQVVQSYFGNALNDADCRAIPASNDAIVLTFGGNYVHQPALRAVHIDGNTSTDLIFDRTETKRIDNNQVQTDIYLKDSYYPFQVKVSFKTYEKEDIIAQWTEYSNQEKGRITLYDYASSCLTFSSPKYYLTDYHGNWANEMHQTERLLSRGLTTVESRLGVRANEFAHSFFYLSLDQAAEENYGQLIGGALAWPGSFALQFSVDNQNKLRVITGINSYAGQYLLEKDETLTTPALLYTYSNEGKGLVSRRFHRWARQYGVYHGNQPHLSLMNNWEATYFNFNNEILTGIINDAADMGFDLFLLDDGWFGNKYPRNNDEAGLGDWEVNHAKLPDGLGYLVKQCQKRNIKFGIWLEPEMVNPHSDLYEKHPDWIITQPHRDLDLSRNQLILDLCNPAVQDYVFNIVDKTMTETPGISYIKWDCNRFVTNSGSFYLSKDKQSHLWVEYVRGLMKVLKRVREKYTDVVIMACSGGGGRIDYGSLPYFDEFWVSDNGDPLDRIRIQWGVNQFFPAICTASHVSVCPNHITGRSMSLKFRFDVAATGKLGMDLQPAQMTDEEKAFCKQAIQDYNHVKEVVQFGDLYRLLSPYESNRVALMYVLDDQSRAVVYSFLQQKAIHGNTQTLYLKGLNPDANYTLKEINKFGQSRLNDWNGKTFSGAFLMNHGVTAYMSDEYESFVFELRKN